MTILKKHSKIIKRMLKLLFSLLLLCVAICLLDWKALKHSILKLNAGMFLLASFIGFFQYVVNAIRWHYLVKKFSTTRFIHHVGQYLYGNFLNAFTPSNVGGDLYRYISMKNNDVNRSSIIISLVRERILGLISYLLIYIFCLFGLIFAQSETFAERSNFFVHAGGFAATLAIGFFFMPVIIRFVSKRKHVKNRKQLSSLLSGLQEAANFKSYPHLSILASLTIIALFIWVLTIKSISVFLECDISWILLAAIVILVELIRMIPVTIQGIGIREGMYAYLFAISDKVPETGFTLATVSYIALNLSLLFSGFAAWIVMLLYPIEKETSQKTN